MPHINIEVSDDLLKNLQVACAVTGETQRAFVVKAILEHATNCGITCMRERPHIWSKITPVEPTSERSPGETHTHDTRSCRVYRCAQCVALGKKF